MRIMARNTGKPCVSISPASAAHQPIRLHANVGGASYVRLFCVPPGAMAGSAKIDRVSGTQAPRVENQFSAFFVPDSSLQLAGFHRLYVPSSGAVASFASDSQGSIARIELSTGGLHSKAVAGEAAQTFGGIDRPRHGLGKIMRGEQRACWREVQVLQGIEKGHTAFAVNSVLLKKIRLP